MAILSSINEKTTSYLTVDFLDKDGLPSAPTSVSYRVDCITTNTEIRADTAITPGASVEITLDSDDNLIINQDNDKELRRVTVTGVYGPKNEINSKYDYWVNNLSGIA